MKIIMLAIMAGFLALFTSFSAANAQCPNGIPSAGNPGCVPPDVLNGSQSSQPGARPEKRRSNLIPNFGAVAFDPERLKFGASRLAQDRREKAEAEAMQGCVASGGGAGCKIIGTYRNGCLALALGYTDSSNTRATAYVGNGPNHESANANAVRACKATGSGTCEPGGFSNCVHDQVL